MRSETYNVDIVSFLIEFVFSAAYIYATTRHVVIILYLYMKFPVSPKIIGLTYPPILHPTRIYRLLRKRQCSIFLLNAGRGPE